MERLRPVYETGVLRLLLRGNSMLYVALLRSTFDPLTGELPREIVEERFSRSLTRLAETGDYTPKEGQTSAEAAHTILQQLTKEGEGDYAWLANSLDVASHRYLYRLTARAHRAIEALDRLEDTTKALSGAQANSIIMEIEHARMQLTADPRERIRLLERDIEERQKQIDELKHSDTLDKLTSQQVGDIIGVIHNTLRGVPIDLRELALEERDNGDNLRRSMQSGSISVEQALGTYHDEYHRSFHESDSGRRFEDAFQVIVTDEGRREIDEAVRDIAQNPYLEGEPGILLAQVRAELKRIYEGIEDVRRQIRISDEAVSRLVRQQTDTHYRTMLDKLHRLFVRASDDAKTHPGSDERPYRTDTGTAQFQALPSSPRNRWRARPRPDWTTRLDERRRAGPEGHGRDVRPAADAHDRTHQARSGQNGGRQVRGFRGELQPAAPGGTARKRADRLPKRPTHAGRTGNRGMALRIHRRRRARVAHQADPHHRGGA